jgi:hypothetical protein
MSGRSERCHKKRSALLKTGFVSSEELGPDAPGTMISNPEFGHVVTARRHFLKPH